MSATTSPANNDVIEQILNGMSSLHLPDNGENWEATELPIHVFRSTGFKEFIVHLTELIPASTGTTIDWRLVGNQFRAFCSILALWGWTEGKTVVQQTCVLSPSPPIIVLYGTEGERSIGKTTLAQIVGRYTDSVTESLITADDPDCTYTDTRFTPRTKFYSTTPIDTCTTKYHIICANSLDEVNLKKLGAKGQVFLVRL